jgi:hypothetical protein
MYSTSSTQARLGTSCLQIRAELQLGAALQGLVDSSMLLAVRTHCLKSVLFRADCSFQMLPV